MGRKAGMQTDLRSMCKALAAFAALCAAASCPALCATSCAVLQRRHRSVGWAATARTHAPVWHHQCWCTAATTPARPHARLARTQRTSQPTLCGWSRSLQLFRNRAADARGMPPPSCLARRHAPDWCAAVRACPPRSARIIHACVGGHQHGGLTASQGAVSHRRKERACL